MNKWLWLALIPSLVFADSPAPQETHPQSAILLTTNEVPVEIEIRADSIVILSDHTVITRDELQVSGNPYDLLLMEFITNRVCPTIQWHTQPGGENLEKLLRNKADAARAIMGCQHRFSRLFEALEKSEQMDSDEDAHPIIPPEFARRNQNPIYVDVEPEQIIIYPEKTRIAKSDIALPGSEFEKFLDHVEPLRETHTIILLLRPGSAVFQRQLRQMIRDRGIEISFEPWDIGREIHIPEFTTERSAFHPPATPKAQPTRADNSEEKPYNVEVRADSLTILPDHLVVRSDELQNPSNAFERLLNQFEAKGECPRICLITQVGGEALSAQLGYLIRTRSVRMGCWMGMSSNQITILVATPNNDRADSKSPVFFECRNQQLFYISLETLKKACADKTAELKAKANNDENEFLKLAAQTTLDVDGQRIDYTYALLNKYVMSPIPDANGYLFEKYLNETDDMWFGAKLSVLDPEKQIICFFVRPDSYKIFQQARAVAWIKNIYARWELLDENDPIMLGVDGSRILP